MLTITIPGAEYFDETAMVFVETKPTKLKLEHSLVSISKWESKWCKPFLTTKLSQFEMLDYIKCMTITQNVDPLVYNAITNENIEQIDKYINAPMTATTVRKKKTSSHRIITSEVIYAWMINMNIPVKFETWHLNRLLTLIEVCEAENTPAKKMSKNDVYNRYREINAARRQKYNTKG